MFNIRASHQEQDLVSMNAALGDVTKGVFFDFADRQSGSAQVDAGVFGPRGVALASYKITESRAVLPGAATHIKFERPLTGIITERHGDTDMAASPTTSILSSPSDCEMAWRPSGQALHSISMSLPVRVLEDFLTTAGHAYSLGNQFVEFDGVFAGRDAQFVDLMRYILHHFERIAGSPRQGDLAEALLLETFADMACSVGFCSVPESVGLRIGTGGSSTYVRLVARAEDYIRVHYSEPLTMPQLARVLDTSLRNLQLAFMARRGITPRQYLSAVRMEEARTRLLQPDQNGNVATLAFDCGIMHLGRFSRAYLEAFGEYPSDTLNRTRRGR